MTKLPIIFIYSRFAMSIAIIVLSVNHIDHYQFFAVLLLSIGLLTDIFDGIIARRINISTETLRRLDSTVDEVFFAAFIVATYIQCPDFFRAHTLKLTMLFVSEGLTYLVCLLKFRKEIATHSIGSKLWMLLIVASLIQIIL